MLYNNIYSLIRNNHYFSQLLYLLPIQHRLGGKAFTQTYNFLKSSEHWDDEKIERYQNKQLDLLLHHAVKNVPYYNDIKLSSTISPKENLEHFPIIDKGTIQDNFQSFLAGNISRKKTYFVSTGGSSGNSLKFYLDNSTYGVEWAFVATAWRRVGYYPGDKLVSIRGVEFKKADEGIFWQNNPVYNTVEMSPFHMSENNLPQYIEQIKKVKPKFIHGYPSAISILAKYVENNEIDFPQIKAVLAVSENIYPEQRELIERALDTRLFSFYGMSEKVIMASECETSTRYHIFPEYGITEIINNSGNKAEPGELGELVGTGFMNYCMPFIRYRTGDYASYSDNRCNCDRSCIIFEQLIGNRLQGTIVGKDGALISMTALNLHSDVFSDVHQYQFFQRNAGEITIRVVNNEGYSKGSENNIVKEIKKKVGNNLEIIVEIVDSIQLTSRGKYKLVIQELMLDEYLK